MHLRIFFFTLLLACFNAEAQIKIVDFDDSMGIKNRARYNIMLQDEGAKKELDFFRKLWKENNPQKKGPVKNDKYKIPKIIHQIWIGSKPYPKLYKKYQNVCKALHPGWEFKFWTNKEVEEFKFSNKDLFDEAENFQNKSQIIKSDILRYEILHKFGGVYLDADVLCLEKLDELVEKYSFFAGLEPPLTYKYPAISNAQMGSYRGNPVFERSLDLIRKHGKRYFTETGAYMIPLTHAFLEEETIHDKSVIFPATYFIPVFPESKLFHYSKTDILMIFLERYKNLPLFYNIKPESITHHDFTKD